MNHPKIKTLEQIIQNNLHPIVFTNGCFDLFHAGHAFLLNEIKSSCDPKARLVVAINSDNSVKQNKGESRPIISESYRAYMVACNENADDVFIFDDKDVSNIIRQLKPDFWFKGGDYTIESLNDLEKQAAKDTIIKTVSFLSGFSSTSIIDKIKNNL